MLTQSTIPLLVRHYANLLHDGAPTAYGGNSSFATTLSEISSSGKMFGLKLPENYTTILHDDFWLSKKNKYYEANNLNQILKIFPGKSEAIHNFVKTNNIDLKKQEDLVKLVLFCNQ